MIYSMGFGQFSIACGFQVKQTFPYSTGANNIIIPALYDLFLLAICQLAQREQQELPIK